MEGLVDSLTRCKTHGSDSDVGWARVGRGWGLEFWG